MWTVFHIIRSDTRNLEQIYQKRKLVCGTDFTYLNPDKEQGTNKQHTENLWNVDWFPHNYMRDKEPGPT